MVNATVLAFALLAALGAALMTAAIANVPDLRRLRLPLRRVDLAEAAGLVYGDDTLRLREDASLLERALAPLARDLLARAKPDELRFLEAALVKLGGMRYFKTVPEVYAAKVLLALAGFLFGVAFALALMAFGAPAVVLLGFPLLFALLHYRAPVAMVRSTLAARREQILFEAPYVLNRLIVFLTMDATVSNAILNIAGRTERGGVAAGGYLVRELRQVAEDYQFWGSLPKAVNAMIARNDDVPIVQRIGERLLMSYDGAASVDALKVIADRAQREVENLIQTRGNQNSTLMIVPTIVALLGIVAAVAGPSLYALGTFLQP